MEAHMIGKNIPKGLIPLFFWSLPTLALIPGCLVTGSMLETVYKPGSYQGSGRGYRGPIQVQVQVSPSGIEDIIIIAHSEGAYPGTAAMEELLEYVLETGSTDLDAISGATLSSRGFLNAVENALGKAK